MSIDLNQAAIDGEKYCFDGTFDPGGDDDDNMFVQIGLPTAGNARSVIIPAGGFRVFPADTTTSSSSIRFIRGRIYSSMYEDASELDTEMGTGFSEFFPLVPDRTRNNAGPVLLSDRHFTTENDLRRLRPREQTYILDEEEDPPLNNGNGASEQIKFFVLYAPIFEGGGGIPIWTNQTEFAIAGPLHTITFGIGVTDANTNGDRMYVTIQAFVRDRIPNVGGYRFPAFDHGPTPDWWQGAPN